jgi:hypothetical protein
VKADVLDRLLGAVGACAIVALGVDITIDGKPLFGVVAAIVGVGLLVQVVVVAPTVAARAWLAWTVPAAALVAGLGIAVWAAELPGSGYRAVAAILGTAGGSAFVRGMEQWFREAGWDQVADRYRRAAVPLIATSVLLAVIVVAALTTSEPLPVGDRSGGGFFGRTIDGPVAWAALPVLFFAALGWWRASAANRFARRALRRADAAVPGSWLVPTSQQPQDVLGSQG